MPEPYDMLGDALQNAEMIVYWSNDPDSTRGTYSGQDSALWRQWLKEKGVKMVFIDPFYNYTNAVMGGKWITPRTGTDAAVAMAIAFVWITEDTYNKDYVAEPHHRLRRVQEVRRWARSTGSPRPLSGRPRNRASRPVSSALWPANGPPSARCSRVARAVGKAAPAGRPTAPSGPA